MLTCLKWVDSGSFSKYPIKSTKVSHKEEEEEEYGEYEDEIEDNDDLPFMSALEDHADLVIKGEDVFESSDDLSDLEDMVIDHELDQILVTAHSEELSHIDVLLYEEQESNSYVHHDFLLGCFPLCIEWLPFSSGNNGPPNVIAIGSFEPSIELWDLNVVDSISPLATLGDPNPQPFPSLPQKGRKGGKRRKHRVKESKSSINGHTGPVLGLSWNQIEKNVLASCSADGTIIPWDLSKLSPLTAPLTHHSKHGKIQKVQSISWHPSQPHLLLSGSYGGQIALGDLRAQSFSWWSLPSDVEHLDWDPHSPSLFLVSTEDGSVTCHDIRSIGSNSSDQKPVWTLAAHSKATSDFSINTRVPGLLATVSVDKTLKLWDTSSGNLSSNPLLHSEHLGIPLFTTSFCPFSKSPMVIAAGGGEHCEEGGKDGPESSFIFDCTKSSKFVEVRSRFGME